MISWGLKRLNNLYSIIFLTEGRTRIGIQNQIYQMLKSVPLFVHGIVSQLILIKVAQTGNTHTYTHSQTIVRVFSLHIASNMWKCAVLNKGGKICNWNIIGFINYQNFGGGVKLILLLVIRVIIIIIPSSHLYYYQYHGHNNHSMASQWAKHCVNIQLSSFHFSLTIALWSLYSRWEDQVRKRLKLT